MWNREIKSIGTCGIRENTEAKIWTVGYLMNLNQLERMEYVEQ